MTPSFDYHNQIPIFDNSLKGWRRIHLRWYHATAPQMLRLLEMIGVPDSTLKMVGDIVATCRVCRTWTRRAPDVKLAVRLSIRFNQCVQVDLLFYECAATPVGRSLAARPPTNHIVLHMVDECIRWSTTVEIPTKNVEDITEAIQVHWLKLYGAPSLMIWDGERAMVSNEASQWASRNQLQLIQRAKHKKAWVAERHNEILRHSMHKTQTQLAAEGISIKLSLVLADATYAKNALLTIGEGTPYIALYGRVPPLLPQIEHIAGTAHLNDETGIEGSRHDHRLHEVTVAPMVETLAERRLGLINGSGPAPLVGELLALRPGDQVEIFRQTNKDRPSWVGPATVKVTDIENGRIMVQWQGRHIECALEGVRRAMIFATFFFDGSLQAFPTYPHATINMVRNALEHIRNRRILLGWIQSGVAWIQTKETKSYYDVFVAVRLASGAKYLPPAPTGASYALTLVWSIEQPAKVYAHRSIGFHRINVREDL